jgi:hypothetical protein
LDDESAWTPSAEDVSVVEAELLKYLRRASTNPKGVDPPMILNPTQPPRGVAELRELIRALPDQRRQYVGIARGEVRFLVVRSFPKTYFEEWRSELAPVIIDAGCAVWSARFDMRSRKLVEFRCSGSP